MIIYLSRFFTCSAGRSNVYIKADGNVIPCSQLTVPLGNILEQPFSEIWSDHNKKVAPIRDITIAGLPCESCDKKEYCRICPGDFFIENGNFLKPDTLSCRKAAILKNVGDYVIKKYLKAS